MAARRPFWKWHRWKSIGFCLWPPSTCIWNLKLKFQSKLDLCSGNHVVYRQTDGQTDEVNPVYPPSNFVGRGYKYNLIHCLCSVILPWSYFMLCRFCPFWPQKPLYSLLDSSCNTSTGRGAGRGAETRPPDRRRGLRPLFFGLIVSGSVVTVSSGTWGSSTGCDMHWGSMGAGMRRKQCTVKSLI